jgi:hypothetical protein
MGTQMPTLVPSLILSSLLYLCLIISTFFSNPVSSSEKVAQLESMLKKRSGINLPSRHQILLNLRQELSNLYDSDPKLLQAGNIDNINKRLEFTKDKITILNILEGEETDSRFKGKFDMQGQGPTRNNAILFMLFSEYFDFFQYK